MRLIWVKYSLLHPVDYGGRIRSYQILKRLAQSHDITYVALDDQGSSPSEQAEAREYCKELIVVPHRRAPHFTPGFWWDLFRNLASPHPYFVMAYESERMREAVHDLITTRKFDALVCDFPAMSHNLPWPLTIPTILFEHNVEAEIWRRMAEIQRHPIQRAYLEHQWRKARRFEADAVKRFDQVVAVSDCDNERIRKDYGATRVATIPNGVDLDAYRPGRHGPPRPNHLVFCGSMDWLPNEDAMVWFLDDILPLIRREIPEMTLTILGRHPRPELVRAAARVPGVHVTGRVDDIRPHLAEATVTVLPLRIGSGTRLKILEAMAFERPVVSTRIGAEGLPFEDGRHFLLADTAEEFAAAVVKLLRHPAAARALTKAAAARVREGHGWEEVTNSFERVLEVTAEKTTGIQATGPAAVRFPQLI